MRNIEEFVESLKRLRDDGTGINHRLKQMYLEYAQSPVLQEQLTKYYIDEKTDLGRVWKVSNRLRRLEQLAQRF